VGSVRAPDFNIPARDALGQELLLDSTLDDEAELQLVRCPRPTEEVIGSFPRYMKSVNSLPLGERTKVERLARLILASFRPGCQPLTEIGLVGHADRDIRRGRDFENRISLQRAMEIRRALSDAVNRMSTRYGLRRGFPPLSLINWRQSGVGASRLLLPNQDRDTFILKAILLSAFIRFSGCLGRTLTQLQQWPTVAQKLNHWTDAVAATSDPCPTLRARLERQQSAAAGVHDAILRLARATPPTPEFEFDREWEDVQYEWGV
jgi:hypothetical protein